jgi:hypothetical protein
MIAVHRLPARQTFPRVSSAESTRLLQGEIMAKRTTHRSSKGTKLYALRDKTGKFKDVQSYKRAHGSDVKRKSKKEK